MAQRKKLPGYLTGNWQHITHAQAWASAWRIAQALINLALSVDRPVAVLSENDLQHALLSLGCMVGGCLMQRYHRRICCSARTLKSCACAANYPARPGIRSRCRALQHGICAAVGNAIKVVSAAGHVEGRISEDFKLATGTFVSAAPPRAKIIAAGAPCAQDAVITGISGHGVGALVFPTAAACALHGDVLAQHFQQLVNKLAPAATSSGNCVAELHVMQEPPLIDKCEVTDKGAVHQSAVLMHRRQLVDALHQDAVHPIFKPHIT